MIEQKERAIKYIHSDSSITTISDLIAKNPLFKDVKEEDLKKFDGETGTSNEDRINQALKSPVLEDDEQEKWPTIKEGCELYVKSVALVRDTLSLESTEQIKDFQSWEEYQTETQKELNSLEGYKPSYKWGDGDYVVSNFIKGINSFFRVWIYCKTENEVVDVTDFCKSLSTTTNLSNSDTFSLELAFSQESPSSEDYIFSEKFIAISNPFQEGKLSSFMKMVTENDVVFISFEQLDCETERESFFGSVDKSKLSDQYYDFLGLVGSVNQSISANGTGRITIEGSSFCKMFQDDEAFFRPIAALSDSFSGNILLGDTKRRGWVKRFFSDSQYHSLFTSGLRTIERTLKFYLNLVSNVGLLSLDADGKDSTDLFSSWGNSRTKLFDIKVDSSGHVDEVSQSLAKGLYQIIKLQVQPELANRHLSDGSVCNPEGTILTLLQGVCAQPLVEMIMDTYKNTFDIICRVPPFNKKSILGWINTKQEKDQFGEDSFGNIETRDVASENLTWETDFYTWFELIPQGTIIPADQLVSLCYIPTLFLSDFIELWGSRKLSVISPYTIIGSNKATNNKEIEQAIQDLCWLVESNFYLPFTRRGTITLASPDRRIKKGQWIRYKKTGEIFYVEGVQQTVSVSSSSVSRQTVLIVSRGLVESFVKTQDGNGYFDILDFDKLAQDLKDFYKNKEGDLETKKNSVSISLNPFMNKKVFDFFCSRKQFE